MTILCYDVLQGVSMHILKWSAVIILLDIILGVVLLKYADPIAFSKEHPYVVLLCTALVLLLPVIVKKYKRLRFSEHTGISIQLIEA